MCWLLAGAWAPGATVLAQPVDVTAQHSAESRVLKSFDEIWQLPQAEQQGRHRLRLEYVVYYYDPLWQALWGRSGESESYLSLGSTVFPIKAGQKILVEGWICPARGLRVEEPKVTILEEAVPLTALPTKGEIGNIERFNKRFVAVEGYVDRQSIRDANHLELSLIVEGRPVFVQLLLRNDATVPQLRDKFIRAKGVYFARNDEGRGGAKIELWVQRSEDIDVFGTLDRDPRFDLPAISAAKLGEMPEDGLVRVTGAVQAQQPGSSVTIRDGATEVRLLTTQTLALRSGEQVEAVGFPGRERDEVVLRQGLVRAMRPTFTNLRQVWDLPESERQKPQRVRFDTVVYYFDPGWRVLWGSVGGLENYLSLGDRDFPIKHGQRVLIEGTLVLRNNTLVEDPKVTVLEESVPIVPLSTRGASGEVERFNRRWVTFEGYVDRQLSNDARHLQLDMIAEGRVVTARMMHPEGAKIPNWEGALLRLNGVYSATSDPTGSAPTIEIWTPGIEHVRVVGSLEDDEGFKLPRTPIEMFGALPPGTVVRVSGVVRSQQPGRSLTIRDETGQLALHTAQGQPLKLGDVVDAFGIVTQEGAEWRLGEALYRKSELALRLSPEGLPRLRLADQLRELAPEEAARGYPVRVSGLVTWAAPNAEFFFIRDVSGGVCVFRPPGNQDPLLVGTRVEVSGHSAPGKFSPVVLATQLQLASRLELPEPRPVTLEQALTGVEDAQWVSMSGYVRAVVSDGPWTRLELTTSAGEFHAMVPPNDRLAKLAGAVVRVRGVCGVIANQKRQLTGIRLWAASWRFIEIEESMPADLFSVAPRSIASLRQFGAFQTMNRRVRVSGVVARHEPGRLVNIQEGHEGLLVLSRDTAQLQPGDRIEAVGFPGRENSRVVLREAVYRRVAAGPEPTPVPVKDVGKIDVELDGRLVRVSGQLLDIGTHEHGVKLISQQGKTVFETQLDVSRDRLPADLAPGAHLALTGVYEIEFDEYRRPHEVRIKLRTLEDVRVLRRPPWWTVGKVLALSGVLAIGLVLGFGWVIALRRRVREQTGVIREQFEKEKAARLEAALARASKLESLGVLAGGIAHDFNNLLTVILGNVSLAKLDGRVSSDTVHCLTESERAALRARDLTQQLLTFAKGGEPMRAATRLPEIVQEAAQFALHGSKVGAEFDVAANLWPADVDKGQIAQVVHNIIINATQAMPQGGLIRIVLRNEEIPMDGRGSLAGGRYVKMSFSDNGSGIPAELLPRIFEPYFTTKKQGSGLGLATVYSIVKKHDGHVEVSSKAGQGTTFHVWVNAAASAPAEGAGKTVVAPPRRGGRVLLMDDEAPIRRLGSAMLKRMGLHVATVSDGGAVVHEYAAATAAGRPFDLVILDLTVPGGMGGAEAMEELRKMDPGVRAIVSSGYSSDPVMANYRAYGFCGRVPKPYAADDLGEVVEAVLRERHAPVVHA